jgi:mannose-6-phosphate isomerase-like protein (cupin superfamily)
MAWVAADTPPDHFRSEASLIASIAMAFSRRVEIIPLQRSITGQTGQSTFSAPQSSDETMIAEVGPEPTFELFCHRRQTDQLMVLRGAIDLILLQEGRLRRLRLREDEGAWVRIPPGVPHGAINRGRSPALIVNAVLRHGPHDPRDYRPRPIPAALLVDLQAIKAEADIVNNLDVLRTVPKIRG